MAVLMPLEFEALRGVLSGCKKEMKATSWLPLSVALALLPAHAIAQSVSLSTAAVQSTDYVVVLSAENAQAQTTSTPSGYDTLQEFTITPADESPSSLGLPSQ